MALAIVGLEKVCPHLDSGILVVTMIDFFHISLKLVEKIGWTLNYQLVNSQFRRLLKAYNEDSS